MIYDVRFLHWHALRFFIGFNFSKDATTGELKFGDFERWVTRQLVSVS